MTFRSYSKNFSNSNEFKICKIILCKYSSSIFYCSVSCVTFVLPGSVYRLYDTTSYIYRSCINDIFRTFDNTPWISIGSTQQTTGLKNYHYAGKGRMNKQSWRTQNSWNTRQIEWWDAIKKFVIEKKKNRKVKNLGSWTNEISILK